VNVAALVDHKESAHSDPGRGARREARPDLHWSDRGEGELKGSLTAELARLGLADRVHLRGYVDTAECLIGESDVFVRSSKEKGWAV